MAFAARGALASAGVSQEQFAEALGSSKNSVIRRMAGRLPFTYPEMVILSTLTGHPLTEILETAERNYTRQIGLGAA